MNIPFLPNQLAFATNQCSFKGKRRYRDKRIRFSVNGAYDWNGRIFFNDVLSYLLVGMGIFIELKRIYSLHMMDCQ